MTPNPGHWKEFNWDRLVECAIDSPRVTAALKAILDLVAEAGIGSTDACYRVLTLAEESAFERERLHEATIEIIGHTTKWIGLLADAAKGGQRGRLEELLDPVKLAEEIHAAVLRDVQVFGSVHLVMGILAGLKAAGAILLLERDGQPGVAPADRVN